MNRSLALCLFAAVAFSPFVRAQSCSGGGDGGMDATGNQCNSPDGLADDASQRSEASAPANAARPLSRISPASGSSTAKRAAASASVAARRVDRPRVVHGVREQAAGQ
jgi:hypothetical protein